VRLQEAGVQVVYGVVGFKTHAKMMLIVRREGNGLRRYAHLSTGNYHQINSRLYTDIGLMTANPEIGEDLHKVFQQLSGLGPMIKLKRLLHSPFTLYTSLVAKIERETTHAKAGRPARIVAKLNALNEAHVIEALYRAAQAGVEIDLIVRGACTLRPGCPVFPSAFACVRSSGAFSSTAACTGLPMTGNRKSIAPAPTGWNAT
jgi:polyphosphate kinase